MKTLKPFYGFLSFSVLVLLFSCATVPPVLDLSPGEGTAEWENGSAWISKSDRRIKYDVAFADYRNYEIHFNVKITNNSWRSILIDPSKFYCVPLEGESDNIAAAELIYANDPEEVILDYRQRIRQEEKDYKTDQGINAAMGCLGIFGGLAAGSKKEFKENDEFLDDINESTDDREQEHDRKLRKYDRSIDFYQKAVLRKTTLRPRQSVRGKVVFAADHNADRVLLFVKGGKTPLGFSFNQSQIAYKR